MDFEGKTEGENGVLEAKIVEEQVVFSEETPQPIEAFPALVTEEEAEEYDEEAGSLGEEEMDPALEAELEAFFQEPSYESMVVVAQRDANMWNQQVFEVQVRDFTAKGQNKENLDRLADMLAHLKKTYGVTPVEPSKLYKLDFIRQELSRLADEMIILRVRAEAFQSVKNEQGLNAVMDSITSIRSGVKKLLALKYKLYSRSKNDTVSPLLEDRRV